MDVKGIRLQKHKGQHILRDEGVIDRQIEYAKLTKKDTVLEIGPGLGALTFKLAKKAGKVVAIEKDPVLYSYLKDKIPKNVLLTKGDVLEVDFPDFDVAVSNLPYQISSPVTFKLLEHGFIRAILMYQKEFAERMTATCGEKDYSRLSVNIYYRAECRILELVSKDSFFPVPEVDSAIVELIPRTPPFEVLSEDLFFGLVKNLFAYRRKKIKNSLENCLADILGDSRIEDLSALKKIIKDMPFADERVEDLSPEKIGMLADKIYLSLHED